MKGPVAHDGHYFANDQWEFIESAQSTLLGYIIDKLPDNSILPINTRVVVSEYPKGQTTEFPPVYKRKLVSRVHTDIIDEQKMIESGVYIPMITMGRYGSLLPRDRPSDDAIVAMFQSAKQSIKLAIQDLGPVCIPSTNIPLPGCIWPKSYLTEVAIAIWERNVQVDIVLSNPVSVPHILSAFEAQYGNGWSCKFYSSTVSANCSSSYVTFSVFLPNFIGFLGNDVAAEIMKRIRKKYPATKTDEASKLLLRQKINQQLRVCFLRRSKEHHEKWSTGRSLGLHSKHFIIDDRCAYIGSQNLYVCDLAEWGVVIDHQDTVEKQLMPEYWNPMWFASYTGTDVTSQVVMDGIDVNRDGETVHNSRDQMKYQKQASLALIGLGNGRDVQNNSKKKMAKTNKSDTNDDNNTNDTNFYEDDDED
jgi:phosphatidylserine/phosphatidylglycerophosphate/cardiolipin synthase-like enzyme